MLGFGGITPITQRQKLVFHPTVHKDMVYPYALLCAIIHDYITIMLIIAIIAIILFYRNSDNGFVTSKANIRDGQHIKGIMAAKNPNALINSVGH